MRLYNRSHLAVRHAIGRADGREPDWTKGVRFAPDGSTWATNEHMLLRYAGPAPSIMASDYPLVPGLPQSDPPLPCTLPLAALEDARKRLLKVKGPMAWLLDGVFAVAAGSGPNETGGAPGVALGATDLESPWVTHVNALAGDNASAWENAAKMLDEHREQPTTLDAVPLCVDARLLVRVLKAVEEAVSRSPRKLPVPVQWWPGKTGLESVYLRAVDPNGGTLEGLVMPMRV